MNWVPFDRQIAEDLHNIEALFAHVVGEKFDDDLAYRSCQLRDGKFVSCVLIPGRDHCTNCHWGGQSHRCKFYKESAGKMDLEKVENAIAVLKRKMKADRSTKEEFKSALKGLRKFRKVLKQDK